MVGRGEPMVPRVPPLSSGNLRFPSPPPSSSAGQRPAPHESPPHDALRQDQPMHAVVCLPTYNERENLDPMVRRLGEVLPEGGRVLVVDDSSPDGTGDLADALARELDYVGVLHRPRKEGLGR